MERTAGEGEELRDNIHGTDYLCLVIYSSYMVYTLYNKFVMMLYDIVKYICTTCSTNSVSRWVCQQ
jgi:hypothetical protein